MEKIVKSVVEKAGISEAQAQTAVRTVVSFLKDKMPPALAGQVDAYLKDGNPGDNSEGLTGKIGGMFGKK